VKQRFAIAVVLAAAVLVWVGPAQAKQLSAFKVGGASGCTTVTDRGVLKTLIRAIETQRELVRVATPSPAPFLRLEYWVKGDEGRGPTFVHYYVPSRGVAEVITGPGSWSWVRPDAIRAVLRRMSKGTRAFPGPRISSVKVGGRAVQDPASYARLFAFKGTADSFAGASDWQRIVIRMNTPSPWSTAAATLEYSKSTNVLWRGNEFVRVPSWIAPRLEAHVSLRRLR
jgi:hypothetical protein